MCSNSAGKVVSTDCSGWVLLACHASLSHISSVRVLPVVTTASPFPGREEHGTPSCQVWLKVGKKNMCGWLIPVTCISVVLVAGLLMAAQILKCLVPPLMASSSHFLPPCRIVLQVPIVQFLLNELRHISARSESSSGGMACHRESYGQLPHMCPVRIIACCQSW